MVIGHAFIDGEVHFLPCGKQAFSFLGKGPCGDIHCVPCFDGSFILVDPTSDSSREISSCFYDAFCRILHVPRSKRQVIFRSCFSRIGECAVSRNNKGISVDFAGVVGYMVPDEGERAYSRTVEAIPGDMDLSFILAVGHCPLCPLDGASRGDGRWLCIDESHAVYGNAICIGNDYARFISCHFEESLQGAGMGTRHFIQDDPRPIAGDAHISIDVSAQFRLGVFRRVIQDEASGFDIEICVEVPGNAVCIGFGDLYEIDAACRMVDNWFVFPIRTVVGSKSQCTVICFVFYLRGCRPRGTGKIRRRQFIRLSRRLRSGWRHRLVWIGFCDMDASFVFCFQVFLIIFDLCTR